MRVVTTVDDIDGVSQAETHSIIVDGYEIEIDLGRDNWDRLARAITPYFRAGRRVPNGKPRPPHPALEAPPAPSSSNGRAPERRELVAKAEPVKVEPATRSFLGTPAITTHRRGEECGKGDTHAGACAPVQERRKPGPKPGQGNRAPRPDGSFSYREAWEYWDKHPELGPQPDGARRRPPNNVRDAYLASLEAPEVKANGHANGHAPTFKAPEIDAAPTTEPAPPPVPYRTEVPSEVPAKVIREWWRQHHKSQQLPYPKDIGPLPPEVREAFNATHKVATSLFKVAAEEGTRQDNGGKA